MACDGLNGGRPFRSPEGSSIVRRGPTLVIMVKRDNAKPLSGFLHLRELLQY